MSTPKTVSIYTLGCKLNFSESSTLGRMLRARGYELIPFEEGADLYIINTCSVTDFADRKCRKIIRRARRHNPQARIIVTGCYAQLKPDEIADIEGVHMVLGAREKFQLLDYLEQLDSAHAVPLVAVSAVDEARFSHAYSFGDRLRSFLKIQDGCDYVCSFCTIPKARGKSRSAPMESLIEQAHQLASQGVKEIVLTGVNVGDYGKLEPEQRHRYRLIDLIRVLDRVEGIERYRISSIEPNLLTDEILAFIADSRAFMPHFHIPLQSGSNKILRRMRRRYMRELYADRIRAVRHYLPDACIGVDVIVGFPGETDEDFRDSYRFIQQLDVNYLHVFTYSERSGTPAASMPDKVPMHIRRQRSQLLRALSLRKRRAFYEKHLRQTHRVLLEPSPHEGKLEGFTENYIRVLVEAPPSMINHIMPIHLDQLIGEELVQGSLAHTPQPEKLNI